MKKYYNKALFYQSFYNVKWGILGGVILFFLLVYYNTYTKDKEKNLTS